MPSPSPVSPPSLSPDITKLYAQLGADQQKLFNKVFMSMWDEVLPCHRFTSAGGVLYSYWLIESIRKEYGLRSIDLCFLTYLYHVTSQGKRTLNSTFLINSPRLPWHPRVWAELSSRLGRKGFLSRTNRDPDRPYLSGRMSKGRKYLRLSQKAIDLIHDIEKQLYKRASVCTFEDLIAGYNKGQDNPDLV